MNRLASKPPPLPGACCSVMLRGRRPGLRCLLSHFSMAAAEHGWHGLHGWLALHRTGCGRYYVQLSPGSRYLSADAAKPSDLSWPALHALDENATPCSNDACSSPSPRAAVFAPNRPPPCSSPRPRPPLTRPPAAEGARRRGHAESLLTTCSQPSLVRTAWGAA